MTYDAIARRQAVNTDGAAVDTYSSATISCLSDELLEHIWLELMKKCIREDSASWEWGGYSVYRPYRWLVVATVCWHWRILALSCTRLYAYIIANRPDAVSRLIQYSGKAPLKIHFVDELCPMVPTTRRDRSNLCKLVGREAYRITHMNIFLDRHTYRALGSCYYSDGKFDASAMQHLAVAADYLVPPTERPRVLPILSYQALPRLTTLRATSVSIQLVHSLDITSLTSLYLGNVSFTASDILELLSRASFLQRFSASWRTTMTAQTGPSTHTTVQLLSLKSLDVPGDFCDPILRYLEFPSSTFITLCPCPSSQAAWSNIASAMLQIRGTFSSCSASFGENSTTYLLFWTQDHSLEWLSQAATREYKQWEESPADQRPSLVLETKGSHCAWQAMSALCQDAMTIYPAISVPWNQMCREDPQWQLRRVACYRETKWWYKATNLLDVLMTGCLLSELPFAQHSTIFPALEQLMFCGVNWQEPIHDRDTRSSRGQTPYRCAHYLLDVLRLRKRQGSGLKSILIKDPVKLRRADLWMLRSADVVDRVDLIPTKARA